MKILIYSSKYHELIDFPEFSETEGRSLFEEIAQSCQLSNGSWNYSDIPLINTEKTRDNLKRIGEKYLHRASKMKRLIYLLNGEKRVDDNAFFYIFNATTVEIYRKMAAMEVLKLGTTNEYDWKYVHNKVFDAWAQMSFQFEIQVYGLDGVKEAIGEPDKSKRICRFCQKPNKSYNSIAHAIPEAIGNKLLICAEECDDCNDELREVEDNFIHLMDFRRAMYKISGKDRSEAPKIKGRNYTIAPDENGDPILYIKKSCNPVGRNSEGYDIYKFNHSNPVIDQDIYRALVKMVIDLTPSDRLEHFKSTISWITKKNQNIIPDALPSVYYGMLPEGIMFEQPMLCLFFRKNDDMSVPYCTAMLFTTDLVYQYVVPYVDVDNGNFKYDNEMYNLRSKLWKYFNIKWEGQQYFSWWQSDIWNYWPVNTSDSNIRILSDNDPIFLTEKRYSKDEMRFMDKNVFQIKDILSFKISSFNAPSVIEAIKTKRKIISAIENEPVSILFSLNLDSNICHGLYSIPFEIDDKIVHMDISFEAEINRLNRINCNDKYITGETFNSIATVLWKKSSRAVDRQISLLLRQYDFKFLRSKIYPEIVHRSQFEFILNGDKVIKTNYDSLVK